MKLSASIVTLLFSSLVASRGLSLFGSEQHVLDDNKPEVPGDNPLVYCTKERAGEILQLEYANLSPNPPVPYVGSARLVEGNTANEIRGQTLKIIAKGKLEQDIKEGAYVLLTVKYGLIRLVSTKALLCDQIKNVDMECPVEKGVITITKDVEIPNEVPPVSFYITSGFPAIELIFI